MVNIKWKKKNTKRGLGLLKHAANNGNGDAQLELGHKYASESKEYHDLSKSISHYTMATDSGVSIAQRGLAIMYLNENNNGSNYIKMCNSFKQARAKGFEYFNDLFKTPIKPSYDIDYSKMLNMFIEVTKKGLNDFH
jgi:TPR repeat protein